MPHLTINGIDVIAPEGATILEAARQVGVDIPTLCHIEGKPPLTSCQICAVKDVQHGRRHLACVAKADDGMVIETECEEIREARRDLLELLLSEHLGDCEAPCRRTCPASMDIPLMTRQIMKGEYADAAVTARRELVLPATLGYVCIAPCEKGCRRAQHDGTVKIRSLHRHAAEQHLEATIETAPATTKRIAIVGSGPAGLAAAFMLRVHGHACTIFDTANEAGGALRAFSEDELPKSVLDAEVALIQKTGVVFSLHTEADLDELRSTFDAVIVAGDDAPDNVFHAKEHNMPVRAVANGKLAAAAVEQSFESTDPTPPPKPFDCRMGKLRETEVTLFAENTAPFANGDAQQIEAARCLHCDCRKPLSCRLRQYADRYGAKQTTYKPDKRNHFEILAHHANVMYEPGKCIKCGVCVEITKEAGEALGLTFIGRGYNARIAVPFDRTLADGLKQSAAECVKACPTGALAFKEQEERT